MYNKVMNFKRNLFSIISLTGCVFAITACQNKNAFAAFEFLDPVRDLRQTVDAHEDEKFDDGAYVKYGDYDTYSATCSDGTQKDIGDAYNVMFKYGNHHIIKSSGTRKIIVVPVQFEDYTIDDLGVKKEDYIANLQKAFFGVAYNNKYVSVAEYYNRSSYGALQLSGTVCDQFYTFPTTVKEINKGEATRNVVYEVYSKVLAWYNERYPMTINEYRLDPEDPKSDVSIYLVYTYPTELNDKNEKVFWDYTFPDKPFSWSSYSCLNTIYGAPDAHTLIHETGHLLGLSDYYPEGETESTSDPAGRIDMMDCSVGDHSGFSKMLLNWARPYYVDLPNAVDKDGNAKKSTEITLRSLSEYGDLILINDTWNGTVFDEYYLIEHYAPTGLNQFDTIYGNNLAKLPTLPGVKIHHVDARLGYFDYETGKPIGSNKVFKSYCNEIGDYDPDSVKHNINLAHDNTIYTKATETDERPQLLCNLYELQLNHADRPKDACATNVNLFREGDSFEITPQNKSFNEKSNFMTKYRITVNSVNYKEAKITIDKLD